MIAEGWWTPYRARRPTCSIPSAELYLTGVGFAVTEGKLSVNDPVISFFPDDLPETISANLRALKVKHLLTMSVGHGQDSTGSLWGEENWVRKFLSLPIPHEPGTVFLYNSGATYMLSAIVRTVTGQGLIDYLTPRLFRPLDITGVTWETCPRGINTGGWGLKVQTEGLAKFGHLYFQKGNWRAGNSCPRPGSKRRRASKSSNLRPIWNVPKRAATGSKVIAINSGAAATPPSVGDAGLPIHHRHARAGRRHRDYERNFGYAGRTEPGVGAPPAGNEGQSPARSQGLPEAIEGQLDTLALTPPKGQLDGPLAAQLSGKQFQVKSNNAHVQAVSLNFSRHGCVFSLRDDQGEHSVKCGLGAGSMAKPQCPANRPH